MKVARLTNDEIRLLREVISKHQPSLLTIIDQLGIKPLTPEQRDELRAAVADELAETGLREDFEPNRRGLLLEDLIDRLGQL